MNNTIYSLSAVTHSRGQSKRAVGSATNEIIFFINFSQLRRKLSVHLEETRSLSKLAAALCIAILLSQVSSQDLINDRSGCPSCTRNKTQRFSPIISKFPGPQVACLCPLIGHSIRPSRRPGPFPNVFGEFYDARSIGFYG